MDVVPAVREDWSVDPFGGSLHDGFVWGRGALDMKGLGVMTMLCAIALKRQNVSLRRPCASSPPPTKRSAASTARSGSPNTSDGRPRRVPPDRGLVRPGRPARDVLRRPGRRRRASARSSSRARPARPRLVAPRRQRRGPHRARHRAYRRVSLAAVGARSRARYLSAFPPQILRLRDGRSISDLADDELEEMLATLSGGSRIQHMLRNTYVPTMVHAGLGQNVIPPSCDAHVDVRSVPGVTGGDLIAELRDEIDDPEVELSLVKSSAGTESPVDSELFTAIADAVHAERPEALIVPFLTSGGTDCKHFRPKGIVCYGHIPFELDDSETERIHGIDERVSVDNLERGMRILLRTVINMCAKEP
jgi:hypothetical protein